MAAQTLLFHTAIKWWKPRWRSGARLPSFSSPGWQRTSHTWTVTNRTYPSP